MEKEVTIRYMDADEPVTIDTDMEIGKLEQILRKCVPSSAIKVNVRDNGQTTYGLDFSQIDIISYRNAIVRAAVVKAPWSDPSKLPLSTSLKITEEVMNIYPPMDFLASYLQSLVGGDAKPPVEKQNQLAS